MQYGVTLPDIDARTVAELATEVEAAGWDGLFVWDTLIGVDVWVALTAAAMRTERIVLGPMLTPVSRRRPWKLASETATLDQLSQGRLVLPVGLGAPSNSFANVGEVTDRATRAKMLDEGLDVLDGLWSGQPFSYAGEHFQIDQLTGPQPFQKPRVPVWVVGAWPRPKSMRRVLRCDGVLAVKMPAPDTFENLNQVDLQELRAYLAAHHPQPDRCAIVMEGETPGGDPAQAAAQLSPLAEGGLTWWLENVWATPFQQNGIEGMRERIRQGPPRIDR